jgi:hypothetical protein
MELAATGAGRILNILYGLLYLLLEFPPDTGNI